MICENMICEKCATEGKTSRVRNTHIVKTLGAYLPFYDEQGRQHFHDANMTNAEYRCTNGHVWHTRGTGSCWCGWPNEQKAAPAEPAAISTSPTKTRRFTVYRRGDLSETHNANQVNPADQPQYEGVVFSDGTTVLRWLTAARSTSVWADAAAPELLAACEALLAGSSKAAPLARIAIAKAKGEKP